MVWILSTRGASTKLRATPFTETVVPGVQSVVYKPGVEPVPLSGGAQSAGELGTFQRGASRISGFLFSHDGSAPELLFAMTNPIDLIVFYRTNGEKRKRTLADVIFIGDATVAFPAMNIGLSEVIGVPFRVQIPTGNTLANHVTDELDP